MFQPYSENYFLDCLLTHFLILGLVISTWRGLWNFQLAIFFPDDIVYGDHFCLALGTALAVLMFALEEPLASGALAVEKHGFWWKLLYEDVCYFVIFFLHGILWRGAWNCTVHYLITDPEKGGWLCFCIGSVGLLVLQNFSYVGGMGVTVDGMDPGRDAFYPTRFVRHYVIGPEPLKSIDVSANFEFLKWVLGYS